MRFQSYTCVHDDQGVVYGESSAFVDIDRSNPAFYCDCSGEPSLTRTEFAEECDINAIMARYEKTGVISHVRQVTPRYIDLSDVPDLQRALNVLADADRAFMTLPAATRREFDNDPAKFVEFAQRPENNERMREWGLAEPLPAEPAVQKVEVVNPSVEPAKAP